MKKILVTGSAGFIGFHLSKRLLLEGFEVVGIDNLNDYYDVSLKEARNRVLLEYDGYKFYHVCLANKIELDQIFKTESINYVVHLAAQAGVRYSLINPSAYIQSNIVAFTNILEGCRNGEIEHLLYASSSSVYGANTKVPFSTSDSVDHPVSLYAATKKANELMAHTYSVNYKLPTTGLRFFTVYGPYGRPDMALFLFTKAMISGKPINVYNYGKMLRDFTYIDDIVESIYRLIPILPKGLKNWNADMPQPNKSFAPYRLFNIGNNSPIDLMEFIKAIESEIGVRADINFMPIQKGDVSITYADTNDLVEVTGFKPSTDVKSGVKKFVNWYKEYYNIK